MTGRSCFVGLLTIAAATVARGGNVKLDGTIPNQFPGVQPQGPNFQISEGFGKSAGGNLLFSFSDFDVDAGESVNFSAQRSFSNVIARVTGGRASTINGAVSSSVPGANLFLVNPSGLVIGNGAQFSAEGAVHVSTAEFLDFDDGNRLDTRGGNDPVLTAAAPAAFGFLSAPKPISVGQATFSRDAAGTSTVQPVYSFVGGDITLLGTSVQANAGAIAIHASGAAGTVPVPTLTDPGTPTFSTGGSVTIARSETNQTPSELNARDGGVIRITGQDVTVNASSLTTDAGASNGGPLEIIASGTVTLTNGALLSANAEASGNTSPVSLTGGTIVIEDSASVRSEILTNPEFSATGTGSQIRLIGNSIIIRTQGNVRGITSTASAGPSVFVRTDNLLIDGENGVASFTGIETETNNDNPGAGRGGDITIAGGDITILREGEIFARTIGAGRAGDIFITGNDMTIDAGDLKFTGLESRVGTGSSGGSGGVIDVNLTGDLLLRRGGAISATTFEFGTGGDVIIRARNVSATETGPGNIDPTTGELFNGVFSRSARAGGGGGAAGSVNIIALDAVLVGGGSTIGVSSNSTTGGAGDVLIDAPRITIDNGNVSAESAGAGGNIIMTGTVVIVTNGSDVNTNAAGDGGELTIAPADVVVLGSGSVINAIAGGVPVKTTIDPTATFIKSPDSTINADNPVLPPDVDVTAGLVGLNVGFVDISKQLQEDCARRAFGNFSTFTVESRGGIKPALSFVVPP